MPAFRSYGAWRARDVVKDWSPVQVLWFCIAFWNGQLSFSDTELLSYTSCAWYPGDSNAKFILDEPVAQAKLLANCILDKVQHSAFDVKTSAYVQARLVVLSNVLVWWFLPDTIRSIRTCAFLEILLAISMSGRALVWLCCNSQTKHGHAVLRVLPNKEAEAITTVRSKLDSWWAILVDRQRLLCNGCNGDVFSLYQLFSDSWRYVGIGSWNRQSKPGQPGLVRRLVEHLLAAYRPKHPEAKKLRYRLCRNTPIQRVFFLVCRTDSETMIRALETLEIRTHHPQANGNFLQYNLGRAKRARRRPPQCVRRRQRCSKNLVCLDESRCKTSTLPSTRCTIDKTHDQACAPLYDMSFAAAYRLVQLRQFTENNVVGPVWLGDPELLDLLLSYATLPKAFIPWHSLENAWGSKIVPIYLLKASKELQSKTRKRTVAQHCTTWLRARGLPDARPMVVEVAHKELMPWVRGRLRTAIADAKIGDLQGQDLKVARAWLRSSLRIRLVRPKMWSDSWSAQAVARKARLHCPLQVPRSGPVVPVKKSWCVEIRQSPDSLLQTTLQKAREHLKLKGVKIPAAKNDPIRFGPVKSWKQHWRDTNDRYEKYTEAFHIPPGCVAVPDDKHKKHAWIVACAFYSLLLGTFAWTAASWEASLLSPTEADSWCRTTLLRVLGPRLFETLGFNGPYKILPSCYMTFKSKCWNFGFRTCQKQQHSCLRKIITYASWPKKFLWKSAHRALDTVIKVHGQTCDTWSLKDATTKLHDGLRMLNGTGHTECARCFRSKPPTAGVAADAGQFYEMIDSSVAVQRMASILQEFSRIEGSKLVVVKRTKKRQAWFSTSAWNIPAGAKAWSVQDLFRMFCSAMFMCYTAVGDKVFKLSGLPIGGFHSKIAASAVLGHDEKIWCNNFSLRTGEGFQSKVWKDDVLHFRYIDDVLLISSIYCCSCLQHALKCIYSVSFEIEASGEHIPWLDCIANCRELCVETQSKQVFPPPPWAAGKPFLKSLFLGRFIRWLQMKASEPSWHRALLALCLDLLHAGWKRRQLLGGLKCIGRLECQQFVAAGCFILRHVVPKQRVDGFGDHLDGARVLGGQADHEGASISSVAAAPSHTSSWGL